MKIADLQAHNAIFTIFICGAEQTVMPQLLQVQVLVKVGGSLIQSYNYYEGCGLKRMRTTDLFDRQRRQS